MVFLYALMGSLITTVDIPIASGTRWIGKYNQIPPLPLKKKERYCQTNQQATSSAVPTPSPNAVKKAATAPVSLHSSK
jgi:hypothetical protein